MIYKVYFCVFDCRVLEGWGKSINIDIEIAHIDEYGSMANIFVKGETDS